MNRTSIKILRAVAKQGELSLAEAIRLGKTRSPSHRDQYPLAILLEDEYLGCTLNHSPPHGADKMREFSQAMMLHAFTIPPDSRGERHYLNMTSSGSVDPKDEKVFIKAKGALFLDQRREKWTDRVASFVIGVGVGVLSAVLV